LEIQAIADGEVNLGIIGFSPVINGQLTTDEIKRCEEDPSASLKLVSSDLPLVSSKTKGPKYVPLSRRRDN
ncbi:MAG TPA: cell cycle transcriptional regulator TrcR, partial [Acidimicrobiales bacterium]|nr:cell cycle transcriptional regulator TrcR [Acidimicrobiales bacterium]